jgi:hypothetical protein
MTSGFVGGERIESPSCEDARDDRMNVGVEIEGK